MLSYGTGAGIIFNQKYNDKLKAESMQTESLLPGDTVQAAVLVKYEGDSGFFIWDRVIVKKGTFY